VGGSCRPSGVTLRPCCSILEPRDTAKKHCQNPQPYRAPQALLETVLDYLVTHGIPKERLVSKGFSSSVPLDTNNTVAGRENNRRVEFVVHFNILNDGSTK
jgi:hypothetical protein